MRSAVYDLRDPAFPVSVVELPDPPLPGPAWARVRVTSGGICGSDLHAVFPDGSGSPIFQADVDGPMEMGHEITGVVTEAGPDSPHQSGQRVAVDPIIACAARGLDPCPRCQAGAFSACLALGSGVVTGGFLLGFTSGLGSGWSDQVVAHASQLHSVPDAVDDLTAVLTEPLSVAVHALGRRPPEDGEPVLVVGAGIIGLACLVAARAVVPSSPVAVLARHPHQQAAARALGADLVSSPDGGDEYLEHLARFAGAQLRGSGAGATLAGGFRRVVEAVGSGASIGLALRLTAQQGTMYLVGGVGRTEVDLAALWFKELEVVGTSCHAVDRLAGTTEHSFDRALRMLADGRLPADEVISHRFELSAVKEACTTAADKHSGAIKVVLHP